MNPKTLLRLAVLPVFAALAFGCAPPRKGATSNKVAASAATADPVMKVDFFLSAEWTVLDVVDRGSPMKARDGIDTDLTTSGRFIQVHYRVKNNSKKEGIVRPAAAKLSDMSGREFGAVTTQESYIPKGGEPPFYATVQPSLSKDFYGIFEVPADATEFFFKVSDFGSVSASRSIALGTVAPPAPALAVAPAASASAKGAKVSPPRQAAKSKALLAKK